MTSLNMTTTHRLVTAGFSVLIAGFLAVALPTGASAQSAGSPFSGFSKNRDKPINFEADNAEMFDTEKRAVLTGNVKVVQGDSTLRAKRLVIWYEDRKEGEKGSKQTVKRMEMFGGVIVTSKDQNAIGESGTYDAKANVATLTDNVVLTQCGTVVKGQKLYADLATNRVRVDSTNRGQRVSGLLNQPDNSEANGCEQEKPAAPSGARQNKRS